MTQYEEDYDDRELMDVLPAEPMGIVPTTINIPVPRVEQITGEIARQLIGSAGYSLKGDLERLVRETIQARVETIVAEHADGVIRELLARPIQPTDNYGNPKGEPTTLTAILTTHIDEWANVLVDHQGRVKSRNDSFGKAQPRIEWFVKEAASRELQNLVDREVKSIAKQLKERASVDIAKRIASQVASLVIPSAPPAPEPPRAA